LLPFRKSDPGRVDLLLLAGKGDGHTCIYDPGAEKVPDQSRNRSGTETRYGEAENDRNCLL